MEKIKFVDAKELMSQTGTAKMRIAIRFKKNVEKLERFHSALRTSVAVSGIVLLVGFIALETLAIVFQSGMLCALGFIPFIVSMGCAYFNHKTIGTILWNKMYKMALNEFRTHPETREFFQKPDELILISSVLRLAELEAKKK